MKSFIGITCALAAMVWSLSASAASVASQPARDVVRAISRGDCANAVHTANVGLRANDAETIFLIGRMFAEGVCIEPDVADATAYFSHAAAQELPAAELEYALQVGLGEGVEQSYERAGELCRKGGLESKGGSAFLYSLGYVCTIRGLASRRLRQTLPTNAILPGRPARVSFNPATGVMQIRSIPRVATAADTTTGTFVQRPLIDAQSAIEKAWREALTAVPKPDAARLENAGTELSLDLDMAIQAGRSARPVPNSTLMPNDIPARPYLGPR